MNDHRLALPDIFARDFARLTYQLHICGAVVSFDDRSLDTMLRDHGQIPSWHYHIIDIEAIVAGAIVMQSRWEDGPCHRPDRTATSRW